MGADARSAGPGSRTAPRARAVVWDVMSTATPSVGVATPAAEVAKILLDHEVESLPVVSPTGEVVGIVSEGDLIARVAYEPRHRGPIDLLRSEVRGEDPRWLRKAGGRIAGDLMTVEPATVDPDDDLVEAARRLLEGHHDRLPVVVGRRLVGTIGRRELLRVLYPPVTGPT